MTVEKMWYESQTVWANVIAIVGVGTSLFGYQIVPDASSDLVQACGAIAAGIASVFSIIGRFKAGGLLIKKPSTG